VRKKRNKRKKITQARNQNPQAQVTQLTQAVLAQKRNDQNRFYFSRNDRNPTANRNARQK